MGCRNFDANQQLRGRLQKDHKRFAVHGEGVSGGGRHLVLDL
jgi:hypothetical protein